MDLWIGAPGSDSAPFPPRYVRAAAFGSRSADPQRRRKKKHLIEATPYGYLHQKLRTAILGGGKSLPPQLNTEGSGDQRPPAKIEKVGKFSLWRIVKTTFRENYAGGT